MLKQTLLQHRAKLFLLAFPLLLIVINRNWIFTPATNYMPDPWFYLAYFRYFDTYAPVFPSTASYFVERLTWNVPGFYIYQLFPPLIANYVLHLIVYYVAVFSLYGTLRLLFNQKTALASALLMSGYPWFLRSVGWDYSDGAGVAHMLLLIYLMTLVHFSEKHRLLLLLAGGAFASLLITNLFWITFTPGWIVYFLVLNFHSRKFKLGQLVLSVAYFLFGMLILAALIALYYQQITGDFVFLKNSIMAAISFTDNATNVKNVRFIYGHMRPYWHVLPAILALVAAWRAAAVKLQRQHYAFVAIFLQFLLVYAWLIFWHFHSIPLLIIFPYSSFALPSIFLLLGGIISDVLESMPEQKFWRYLLRMIFLISLPFALVRIFPDIEGLMGNPFLIASVGLVLLAMLMVRLPRVSFLTITTLFALVFYLVGEKAYVYDANPDKWRDHYESIIRASDVIDEHFPNRQYSDFRLWFRADENYDTFFSLSALYLYSWGSVIDVHHSRQEPSASLAVGSQDQIEQGDAIVILSSNPNSMEVLHEANRALSRQNAKLEIESRELIQQGEVRFVLYFTRISILP